MTPEEIKEVYDLAEKYDLWLQAMKFMVVWFTMMKIQSFRRLPALISVKKNGGYSFL